MGITASPFCAVFASLHKQAAPAETISNFIQKAIHLKTVQTLGSTVCFTRPLVYNRYALAVTVFSDAGRWATNEQLCYAAGLLLGELRHGSVSQTLSCTSYM